MGQPRRSQDNKYAVTRYYNEWALRLLLIRAESAVCTCGQTTAGHGKSLSYYICSSAAHWEGSAGYPYRCCLSMYVECSSSRARFSAN